MIFGDLGGLKFPDICLTGEEKSRWSPEDPVSQIHSPHLHAGAPGIFSNLLRSVQMLKREREREREWGEESNGKLTHLFIPSKTTTLIPEFAVEDLTFGRTATLVRAFEVKDLLLGRTLWWLFCLFQHETVSLSLSPLSLPPSLSLPRLPAMMSYEYDCAAPRSWWLITVYVEGDTVTSHWNLWRL